VRAGGDRLLSLRLEKGDLEPGARGRDHPWRRARRDRVSGSQPRADLDELFNFRALGTLKGFILIVVGGFLVGFGTRYAGGCTSGHSIMGMSNLQWPSLVATCCFFAGGLLMTWVILPRILGL
jgi:uncharacterized membrane protein YedE/YeeE